MELGLYVAVKDLASAGEFYSRLFNSEPTVRTPAFLGFELAGGRFGVMLESAYAVPVERGNSTVANFRVDDIDAEHERVRQLGPSKIQDDIVAVGPTRLFMFADPDGNVIEFNAFEPEA